MMKDIDPLGDPPPPGEGSSVTSQPGDPPPGISESSPEPLPGDPPPVEGDPPPPGTTTPTQ